MLRVPALVFVLIAGCASSPPPAPKSSPTPEPAVHEMPPPVPAETAQAAPPPPPPPAPEPTTPLVARGGDPCDGGEIASGTGGGGTGESIGIGSIGTLGHGSGTGRGYGVGSGRGGGHSSGVPTVRIGAPQVNRGLDPAIVKRVLQRARNKLLYCYEKQLAQNPALVGTVRLAFEIEPDGTVSSPSASGVDTAVADCVQRAAASIAFPVPKPAARVTVSVALSYAPPAP